jgi:hypothetical protein
MFVIVSDPEAAAAIARQLQASVVRRHGESEVGKSRE